MTNRSDGDADRVPESAMRRMKEFAAAASADGITLWLASPRFLEAVANPLEPEIVGLRQPTDRGLISRVYLTGQAILEHALPGNPLHDPRIDRQLGKACRAMMAAPLDFGDDGSHCNGGVISLVSWRDNAPLTGFSLDGLERLTALARVIVREWSEPP